MFVFSVVLLIAVSTVDATFTTKGECTFDKYEGGDGTNVEITAIPPIEASVPSTVLANMFGQKTSGVVGKLDLAANGWMHATNTLKGTLGMFSKVAPVLAPCLGLIGVAFGGLNRNFNSVSPAQIIEEVNKAIEKVIEATNRRFELLEEYVDESARNIVREMMQDHYKGQFETWGRCASHPTKAEVDACQKGVARTVNSLKYRFVHQTKFKDDPEGEMNKADIKFLEIQLPVLKKWADFHLLAYGALVKMYEGKTDTNSQVNYENYRSYLVTDGKYYVNYMKWAMRRITKARVDDQLPVPKIECDNWDDNTYTWFWWTTGKYHTKAERRCKFKQSTMKPQWCDLTTTWTGEDRLCDGMFCKTGNALASTHSWMARYQERKANELYRSYQNSLKAQVANFWRREVRALLPDTEATINSLDTNKSQTDANQAGSREDIEDPEGSANVPEDQMEKNRMLTKIIEKNEQEEEELLAGTNSEMSMVDYFTMVKENDITRKKKMKKGAKKARKHGKKTGQ